MVGLVLALGLIVLIGIRSYPYWSIPFASTPQEFSEEAWRESNRFCRQLMAQDFLNRHAPVAMHRDQVMKLLGEPDIRDPNGFHYFVALTAGDYILLSFVPDGQGPHPGGVSASELTHHDRWCQQFQGESTCNELTVSSSAVSSPPSSRSRRRPSPALPAWVGEWAAWDPARRRQRSIAARPATRNTVSTGSRRRPPARICADQPGRTA
jgi:hypothetical protein